MISISDPRIPQVGSGPIPTKRVKSEFDFDGVSENYVFSQRSGGKKISLCVTFYRSKSTLNLRNLWLQGMEEGKLVRLGKKMVNLLHSKK